MTDSIAVIRGDGIGPEIVASAIRVFDALGCGLEYEYVDAGLAAQESCGELLPQATLNAIERHGVALKGPLTTPIGKGFSSLNVALRRHFELYANLRPVVTFPGTRARYDDIDIITVRENTEGAYRAEEQTVSEDGQVGRSVIQVTRAGSERIVRYAFELAKKLGRKKISVVHKANILKAPSGLFLDVAREIAAEYPAIEMNELIVDNTCMQLVMDPHKFDVIVTTNLFGDIVSDLCAGLVGGLGLAPGANIGDKVAIFEAVHGSAPDIAGKGVANPSALLLAGASLLDHIGQHDNASRIRVAIRKVLAAADRTTPDLGGKGTTESFTDALVERL